MEGSNRRELIGSITLADGATLKLKVDIVDIKESGFSPFGGINFDVKLIGGVATQSVPEDLREAVKGKPLAPSEPPREGWEPVDIVKQEPAVVEEVVESSKGVFKVRVEAEATMVARNTSYRTASNEPVYWVTWVYKVSWKPVKEGE